MAYHPRMQRAAGTIIIFLILGAVVNVAIAWGIAWSQPQGAWRAGAASMRGYTHDSPDSWEIDVHRAPGRVLVTRYETNWPRYDVQKPLAPPRWSEAATQPQVETPERPNRTDKVTETAYGWPLVSMMYEYDFRHLHVGFSGNLYYFGELRGGVLLSRIEGLAHPNDWRPTLHVLPLRIIWLNFFAGAAIYGGAFFILFCAPRWVRSAHRRRRGLCPACGYPRGESSVCTECGRRLAG